MDPLITAQHHVRQNADELQDFLRDLNQWKDEMTKKEKEIGTLAPIEEQLPPIRGSKNGKSKIDVVGKNKKNKAKEKEPEPESDVKIEEPKAKRISSYDYGAWDKFDADKACEELDKVEENIESDDDEEELSEDEDYEVVRKKEEASEEKEKGNDFFRLGKIDQAIECYTRGILCDPTNAFLPANRALALLKKEMYSAAEQDCNLALDIDADYVKAIQRRGIARAALKKSELAKDDFRRVLQLEPGNKQAYDELIKLKELEVKETSKPKVEKIEAEAKTKKQSQRIQIEEVSSGVEDKNIVKPIDKPPHLRSKKPLKRMNITEVTSRECKKETPVNVDVESTIVEESKVKEINLPVCPQTNYQFQMAWRTLKNYPEMKYSYLKQIPYESFNTLFEFLENDLLADMLNIMNEFYIRNGDDVYNPLKYFSELKRFPILSMFLSSRDKEVLRNLFQYIKNDTKWSEDSEKLAHNYQIKL